MGGNRLHVLRFQISSGLQGYHSYYTRSQCKPLLVPVHVSPLEFLRDSQNAFTRTEAENRTIFEESDLLCRWFEAVVHLLTVWFAWSWHNTGAYIVDLQETMISWEIVD